MTRDPVPPSALHQARSVVGKPRAGEGHMTGTERVARAIKSAWTQPLGRFSKSEQDKTIYTIMAEHAIAAHKAALVEAGLVIVPREPDMSMQAVGNEAIGEEKYAGYVYRVMIAKMEQP